MYLIECLTSRIEINLIFLPETMRYRYMYILLRWCNSVPFLHLLNTSTVPNNFANKYLTCPLMRRSNYMLVSYLDQYVKHHESRARKVFQSISSALSIPESMVRITSNAHSLQYPNGVHTPCCLVYPAVWGVKSKLRVVSTSTAYLRLTFSSPTIHMDVGQSTKMLLLRCPKASIEIGRLSIQASLATD